MKKVLEALSSPNVISFMIILNVILLFSGLYFNQEDIMILAFLSGSLCCLAFILNTRIEKS